MPEVSVMPAAVPGARRLRVLQVIGNGIVGGMESVVERLVERLPRDRVQVSALCPYEGALSQRLRRLGIDCGIVPMPDDPPWAALQTVAALVRSGGIDVIHAHLSNAHVLAALVGRLCDRPVLATLHGRQMNLTDLELHHAAGSHLCAVCRHSELHALGVGADPARLSCIPNGVDTSLFVPRAGPHGRDLPGWPADAAASGGGPVIGFVGRLSPEKAPDLFVRAAVLLRQRLPGARFVLTGEGPMRPMLEVMVARHRLGARVGLTGASNDMLPVYQGLDVLVSTSHSEAMPLAVMEAMSCGLPVVATRVGGVPDLVEHGVTGWLADPGNAESIAAFIAQACADREAGRRMGLAGRARMAAGFELDRSVGATARLYTQLHAGGHGNPVPRATLAALGALRGAAGGSGKANGTSNGHHGAHDASSGLLRVDP